MKRVLSGAAVVAVIWVGLAVYNGDIDLSGLDPRQLFAPDYTTFQRGDLTAACDPADSVGGTFGTAYGECLAEQDVKWEKAKATVRERGFNDGRKHSCDSLRGRYVAPDAARTARDAYESAELRATYEDGYEEGAFSVLVSGC